MEDGAAQRLFEATRRYMGAALGDASPQPPILVQRALAAAALPSIIASAGEALHRLPSSDVLDQLSTTLGELQGLIPSDSD